MQKHEVEVEEEEKFISIECTIEAKKKYKIILMNWFTLMA